MPRSAAAKRRRSPTDDMAANAAAAKAAAAAATAAAVKAAAATYEAAATARPLEVLLADRSSINIVRLSAVDVLVLMAERQHRLHRYTQGGNLNFKSWLMTYCSQSHEPTADHKAYVDWFWYGPGLNLSFLTPAAELVKSTCRWLEAADPAQNHRRGAKRTKLENERDVAALASHATAALLLRKAKVITAETRMQPGFIMPRHLAIKSKPMRSSITGRVSRSRVTALIATAAMPAAAAGATMPATLLDSSSLHDFSSIPPLERVGHVGRMRLIMPGHAIKSKSMRSSITGRVSRSRVTALAATVTVPAAAAGATVPATLLDSFSMLDFSSIPPLERVGHVGRAGTFEQSGL